MWLLTNFFGRFRQRQLLRPGPFDLLKLGHVLELLGCPLRKGPLAFGSSHDDPVGHLSAGLGARDRGRRSAHARASVDQFNSLSRETYAQIHQTIHIRTSAAMLERSQGGVC